MFNPQISYLENLAHGPNSQWQKSQDFPQIEFLEEPKFSFLGNKIHLPFGIPAGPLLDSRFVNLSINAGFCVATYKTVRSRQWNSHPWPNVLEVCHKQEKQGLEIEPQDALVGNFFKNMSEIEIEKTSITNSFGVPSQTPDMWSTDFQKIVNSKLGNFSVLSFQGSQIPGNKNFQTYVEDFVLTANLAAAAVSLQKIQSNCAVLEMNLSCPNEAGTPLFLDLDRASEVIREVKNSLKRNFPDVKLIAKVGIYSELQALQFLKNSAHFLNAIAAINTVPATVKSLSGEIILGSQTSTAGICGAGILHKGLQVVQMLARLLKNSEVSNLGSVELVGVGGISKPQHAQQYLNAGATISQSATAAMWNLNLASEFATALKIPFRKF